jgi:hypothetical protein
VSDSHPSFGRSSDWTRRRIPSSRSRLRALAASRTAPAWTQAPDWAGRRLVRLIAGNPVTMGQMTRHVADAGSYAPVTILIEEMPDGRTRVAYDTVASQIAPYHDAAASAVAERLDTEVLGLLRQVTAASGSGPA